LIAVVHNLPWRQVVTAAEAHLAAEEAEVEAQQAALARLRAGYRAEEIAVAKAELDEAKASLTLLEAGYRKEEIAQAQAELNAALALAAHLEREAARSEALITKNFVSRSEADRNRAAADAAGARVLALEAVLSRLKAGPRTEEIRQAQSRVQVTEARLALMQAGTRAEEITEAEARLEAARARVEAAETALEAAQRDVGYCMVRAPHDGVILEITAPAGTWLHAEKRAIVHMYDAAQMQARVDVRQENAATLEIGQQCTVKLESRKDAPYTGRVVRIDPQGNLARDTVRVRVQIENPDALLRIDLTVTVDFLAAEAATQAAPLVVPTSAVFKRDGGFHVFAVRGGEARLRPVELGKQTATGYVVLSGIDAGEVVATGNLAMLADGTPVTLSEDAP
jgi:RND family efflux transporter MFP subunit